MHVKQKMNLNFLPWRYLLNIIPHKGALRFLINGILLGLCLSFVSASAQPSGGPYGPLHQKYVIPKDAGKIYYVAPFTIRYVDDAKAPFFQCCRDNPGLIGCD